MNRPPLENARDDVVNYLLHLEKENIELKAEVAKLKREASLKKTKVSIEKKNTPPSSNGKNYPTMGINIQPI
jgi:hypothetical protein